ncbi:LiaF transmembrane domain-containing protein [Vallitalea okinawensis]|uniref:LiaF transmembrane domain-containing protein n=1 Tax=Vallitalea okinawensis TaxID=2078660 RepID=UPI000CFCD6A4|nr:DUF5668 domain-containing protein [Vallitalea okinawensis]
MNKQKVTNGLLLIIVGVVFLLMSLDLIDSHVISYAIDMWPVILILIGINVIFKNEWVKWASIVAYAALVLVGYTMYPDLFGSVSQIMSIC